MEPGELLDELAALVVEVLGHHHLEDEVLVAAAGAFAAEPQFGAAAGAGWHFHREPFAIDGRYLYGGAEDCLAEADRHLEGDIAVVFVKIGMRLDGDFEDHIAGSGGRGRHAEL